MVVFVLFVQDGGMSFHTKWLITSNFLMNLWLHTTMSSLLTNHEFKKKKKKKKKKKIILEKLKLKMQEVQEKKKKVIDWINLTIFFITAANFNETPMVKIYIGSDYFHWLLLFPYL